MQQIKIIELQAGKKKLGLVAGLIWHPLQNSGSARAKEILAYAQARSADLKVMRGDDSPHVGLAKKADGALSGQLSVAAVIADALAANGHRNILFAATLPDDLETCVFVSVRDGVILADGDSVGAKEDIRVRLVGDVAYGGWDLVVCPAEWSVIDAQERDFISFFPPDIFKDAKQWQLKETTIAWRKAIAPVLLLAFVTAASLYGWSYWQKKSAADAEALRLQQQEVALGQRVALAEPPKPWPLMPNAQQFTRACMGALQQVGLTAGNWSLDGAVCEADVLTVRWLKSSEGAWVSHLKVIRPGAVIANDGLSATVSVAAVAAPSNDFTTTLPPASGLSLRYYDLASRYGMAVRIEQPQTPTAPATLPGQAANSTAALAPSSWVAMPLQITANFSPLEVASVLDFPGLRFTKLVFAYKSGAIQYQFNGVQYVRP